MYTSQGLGHEPKSMVELYSYGGHGIVSVNQTNGPEWPRLGMAVQIGNAS